MAAEPKLVLLTCAFADENEALAVARELVETRLAAAVHVTRSSSHFIWQGELREVQEFVLDAKTLADRFERIVALIKSRHGYELPGISYVAIGGLTAEYRGWILSSIGQA